MGPVGGKASGSERPGCIHPCPAQCKYVRAIQGNISIYPHMVVRTSRTIRPAVARHIKYVTINLHVYVSHACT